MLIKVNVEGKKWESLVDELKEIFNEQTASGATKMAIRNYKDLKASHEYFKKKAEKFENLYSELSKLVREKSQIEASIRQLTGN